MFLDLSSSERNKQNKSSRISLRCAKSPSSCRLFPRAFSSIPIMLTYNKKRISSDNYLKKTACIPFSVDFHCCVYTFTTDIIFLLASLTLIRWMETLTLEFNCLCLPKQHIAVSNFIYVVSTQSRTDVKAAIRLGPNFVKLYH